MQFFVCEQLARLGWPGHYSLRTNYISDLGARSLCAAHALMNASFLTQSILIAASALLLPRRSAAAALAWPARVALLQSALGLLAVSAYPEDLDMNTHLWGAKVHFLIGTLAMLLAACGLLSRRREPGVGTQISITLLFAGLAAAGDLLLLPQYASVQALLGLGLVERLAAYPLPLWLAWTGYQVLKAPQAPL